ncbi:MAG: carboxypeptidase regulatory-like domain-containing protein [Phycisphaerae bacterium]|nr:carboxypeptidase regulatory-like domain-containing protein [Phycisphaerae bacterium]
MNSRHGGQGRARNEAVAPGRSHRSPTVAAPLEVLTARGRRPWSRLVLACSLGGLLATACVPDLWSILGLPVETRLAFTNLSTRFYAAMQVRTHGDGEFVTTPLLAPGATFRADCAELLDAPCPGSLDVRVLLYRRVHEDLPIGLDATEEVEAVPLVAGEVRAVPACEIEPLETYTIVNWDAPEGTARVKFAQGTAVDSYIRQQNLFPNVDTAWEISGVTPALAEVAPPPLADPEPVSGRVILANGTGVENIGVLLRTRFRVRLDDADEGNDPDSDWSDPIAVTKTDAAGQFAFDRPAGVYQVEVFADGYLFRPVVVEVETPQQQVIIIAEPQG